MPWKLVAFLSALIVAALFIGFNLDNRCDVSLIFYTFRSVPICVSLLVAFVVGSIAVIPFFIVGRSRRNATRGSSARRSGSSRSPSVYRDDDLGGSSGRTKSSRKSTRTSAADDFPSDDYDID